ncbi:MAG: hypothetical protein IPG72_07075 [Ardenticatenales bacterium]|nr:hypothetical protein [Ardenticatenales bacterium]
MSTRDAKGDGEMKRFVFLTMIALAIVLSPAQVTVFAQTCPVNTVRQFARVEAVESLEIVQADQTIEVADEWLNGCSGPPSAQTYIASNVDHRSTNRPKHYHSMAGGWYPKEV